ncbi:MAG: hypothetical protein KME60_28425 [Cyanomargarita calcarea GSE-NOS-MK-12-04C]|jgi:hypothetical protein|uniref:Uncharacterized protein n=1 Tax=Cyanomargarita calcarea GSE-NOS-MK-12-04C TaxID=2839659 RepID=A0A951QUK3_9CYAN|nr:hypothetical protein [Cyanomargarita calcarea GSE-NOS-MK-12-04C]
MTEENKNTYNIGSIGGNFNQSVEGGYTQIHGNQINMSQDLAQAAAQIEQLLTQLQSQGYSSTDSQQKVASDWASETDRDPKAKSKMVKLGQYVRDAATSSVIGEAAVEVIKLALRISGIPLP